MLIQSKSIDDHNIAYITTENFDEQKYTDIQTNNSTTTDVESSTASTITLPSFTTLPTTNVPEIENDYFDGTPQVEKV